MAYLEDSRNEDLAEKEIIKKRARTRKILVVGFVIFLTIVAILLGFLTNSAWKAQNKAELERKKAITSDSLAQIDKNNAIESDSLAQKEKREALYAQQVANSQKEIAENLNLKNAASEYARLIHDGPSDENGNENTFYKNDYFLAYSYHFDQLGSLLKKNDTAYKKE